MNDFLKKERIEHIGHGAVDTIRNAMIFHREVSGNSLLSSGSFSYNILLNGDRSEDVALSLKGEDIPVVTASTKRLRPNHLVCLDHEVNLSDLLNELLKQTNGNIKEAQKGVIILNNFDAIGKEEDLRRLQGELVHYMSGQKIPVQYNGETYQFNTSKLSFICMGDFPDIDKPEGLASELTRRFSLSLNSKKYELDEMFPTSSVAVETVKTSSMN